MLFLGITEPPLMNLVFGYDDMLFRCSRIPRKLYIFVASMSRCYLHCGDLDKGVQLFDNYMSSGKVPMIELYVVFFCIFVVLFAS